MNFIKKSFRFLYQHIPFKSSLFKFIRLFGSPPESIYKHLHFKGIIKIFVSRNKHFKMHHYGFQLENDVFWKGLYGLWERKSLKLWTDLSLNSTVVMDIGSNTGIYSLVSKTINPEAKVFAFEPVRRVFEKLESNIYLNKYDISIHNIALSNYSGNGVIYDTFSEHVYSATVNAHSNEVGVPTRSVDIQIKRLDDFITEIGLSRIDLMKIDVERHEPEVLEGFKQHIFKFEPSILIEILDDEIGKRVGDFFSGSSYLFYNIDETTGLRKVSQITHSDSFNYLLCTPKVAGSLNLEIE